MNTVASFDPPTNHWDADFDARLVSTLTWLKERVESDEQRFKQLIVEAEKARDEARQYLADAKFYAVEARKAVEGH